MKLKNISPVGAVFVAALDMRQVGAGEVVDVGEDVAALLLIQTANWELAETGKPAREFADKTIAEHLAHLAAASVSPLVATPGVEATEPTTEGMIA